MLKPLPLGLQTFSEIIKGDYVYVDKTQHVHNVLKIGKYLFLTRPRRFGKSLFVSTLKEMFLGNKELFKNLWLGKSDYDFTPYPVIHIDFGKIDRLTPEKFEKSFMWSLQAIAEDYDIDITNAPTIIDRLTSLVKKLAKKNKVVLLIDEYDKPIIDHIDKPDLSEELRDILKGFFDCVKALDEYWHKVFITGVSRFSGTSLFSGFNNLNDLSLDIRVATAFGYTQEEFESCFKDHIIVFEKKLQLTHKQCLEQLKGWYNGYKFCQESEEQDSRVHTVYNSYSPLLLFDHGSFKNYWFKTGTPTFLIRLINQHKYAVQKFETESINDNDLDKINIRKIPFLTLLLQTGYLTIKDYNQASKNYQLVLPNNEVRESLFGLVFETLTDVTLATLSDTCLDIVTTLNQGDINKMLKKMRYLFAEIPYDIQLTDEKYYQTIFFVLLKLLGVYIHTEVVTNVGRVDAVIVTPTTVFLFEFKVDKPVEMALAQIKENLYYEKYLGQPKPIVLVGLIFDSKLRNIREDWLIETCVNK